MTSAFILDTDPHLAIDEGVDIVDIPKTNAKGTCKVCGGPARNDTATVCDEHDGRRTRGNGSPARAVTRRSSSKSGPNANDWTDKVLSKVFVFITLIVAQGIIKRKGVHDPNDDLADHLTMTNDEAKAVSKPIARVIADTKINKLHGHKIVENFDVLDAFFAFLDWQKRVNSFLDQNKTILASVSPIRSEPTPPAEANEYVTVDEEDAPTFRGSIPDGTSGEHFVI